jgi:hypothetical protein
MIPPQQPQRSASVFTGASHKDNSSSSTFNNVMDTPCISSEVQYAPTQVAFDDDARLGAALRQPMVHAVQLGQRRGAQVVDQRDHPIAARQRLLGLHLVAPLALLAIPDADRALIVAVVDQRMEHVIHRRVERGERTACNARLAVNADAELHLVLRQGERRFAGGGNGTGAQRDADRMPVVVDAMPQRHHAVQIVAARRGGAQQFLHQHGLGHPAPSGAPPGCP